MDESGKATGECTASEYRSVRGGEWPGAGVSG